MHTINDIVQAAQAAALTRLGISLFGREGSQAGIALELAYAKILGWRHNGGTNDNGLDLVDPETKRGVQIKTSVGCAKEFLRKCTKKRKFIPVCIGRPGTKEEMLDSINKYGAWMDHSSRSKEPWLLDAIARRRARVYGWRQELLWAANAVNQTTQ